MTNRFGGCRIEGATPYRAPGDNVAGGKAAVSGAGRCHFRRRFHRSLYSICKHQPLIVIVTGYPSKYSTDSQIKWHGQNEDMLLNDSNPVDLIALSVPRRHLMICILTVCNTF